MREGYRIHILIVAAACLLGMLLPRSVFASGPDAVILKIRHPEGQPFAATGAEFRPLHRTFRTTGITPLFQLRGPGKTIEDVVRIELSSEKIAAAIAAYQKLPGVVYAEPDTTVRAYFTPNDPQYPSQWHWSKIHADAAWDFDVTPPLYGGDPSVIIAVIDTGIAYESYIDGLVTFGKAPDFGSTAFVAGHDFVNQDAHPNDDNGHGTHVAGTIAESSNNAITASGLAFNSSIMPIKVLDRTGVGSMSDVASAIDFAVANGADVINLSLGAESGSQALADAVQLALNAGVVVVAAAGNDSLSSIGYPAAYPGVLAVTALGRDDVLASYSNSGAGVSLSAPGGDDGEYIWQEGYNQLDSNNLPLSYTSFGLVGFQGTSQATPQVAGAAALLIARGASGANVKTLLETSATDLGPAGYDQQYGYGRLNIEQAFTLFINDTTPPVSSLQSVPALPDGANGYYSTLPLITLAANDEAVGSGLSRIIYAWDSATASAYSTPFNPPQGVHTLSYFAIDGSGNQEPAHTVSFSVDSVGPVVTVTTPASVNNPRVTIQGTVNDATTAVASLTLDGTPIQFGADGTFSFTKVLPLGAQTLIFLATDRTGSVSTTTHLIVVTAKERVITGAGPGGGPQLVVATNGGKKISSFFALPKKFRNGMYVAVADINGDGSGEVLVTAQSGENPEVKIFNNRSKLVGRFRVYEKTFSGGVRTAGADLDGNGTKEILLAPGPGRSPQIRIVNASGKVLGQFLAFSKTFKRGITIAAGDLDGDGKEEILAGAGPGGGPQIRIFNAKGKLLGQFFAFPKGFRGGVRIASGDIDGDGQDEIIAIPGPGGGPQIRIFNAKGKLLGQFFAWNKAQRKGSEVAAGDVNGDGLDEIVVGAEPGSTPSIRIYTSKGRLLQQFTPFAKTFRGGITIATGVTD